MRSINFKVSFSDGSHILKRKFHDPEKKPVYLPPCKVCNGLATGFHYGANTCEACKVFYRRYYGKEHNLKPCWRDGGCANENPAAKSLCSECRFQKCINVGMTLGGIKKGRYTYEKRWQNAQELENLVAIERIQKHFNPELSSHTLELLKWSFSTYFPDVLYIVDERETIRKQLLHKAEFRESDDPIRFITSLSPSYAKINADEDAFYANLETTMLQPCTENNEDTVTSFNLMSPDAMRMIWLGLSSCFESQLGAVVRFMKCVPGFLSLNINDQKVLLKESYVEVLVFLRCLSEFTDFRVFMKYYPTSKMLKAIPVKVLNQRLDKQFCNFHKKLAARVNKLKLKNELISVLIGLIILSPDRELEHPKSVEKLQLSLLDVLQYAAQRTPSSHVKDFADILLILPQLRESSLVYFSGNLGLTD